MQNEHDEDDGIVVKQEVRKKHDLATSCVFSLALLKEIRLKLKDQSRFFLLDKAVAKKLCRHYENHNDKSEKTNEGAWLIRLHVYYAREALHSFFVLLFKFVVQHLTR